MKFESLHDLYINELHNLYNAENQIVKAMPKMIESAHAVDLRNALNEHLQQTHEQVRRLQQVFQLHHEEAKGQKCKGMEGLIEEGKDMLRHEENADVRDAAIIAAAQKMEHYEMASYGAVRTWARQMGHTEAVDLLQRTLDEEGESDKRLTQIAQSLNIQAVRHAG
jgi:ferritin-like metal-binding protein YciE